MSTAESFLKQLFARFLMLSKFHQGRPVPVKNLCQCIDHYSKFDRHGSQPKESVFKSVLLEKFSSINENNHSINQFLLLAVPAHRHIKNLLMQTHVPAFFGVFFTCSIHRLSHFWHLKFVLLHLFNQFL